MRLWPKILLLALVNVVLLATVLVAFARAQFRFGPESLLLGPAHDRLRAVGDDFEAEFETAPPERREALLADYGKRYGAEFAVTHPHGEIEYGPAAELPPEVRERMQRLLPPPGRRRPPPPPDRFDDRPLEPPRPQLPPESVFLVITHSPTRYWAGVRIQAAAFETPGHFAFLVMRSGSVFESRLFFDWRLWAGVALTLAAVSFLCWFPFIRGLTRAIHRMDRATAQIAEGRFDVHVRGNRSDELGHLGQQINRMASRLESFVKNQKRFLGDIAHELCAPIARIQFALGILEQNTGDAERRHVAAVYEEVQEMSALVNELLSFSKAGLRSEATPLAPVEVGPIARQAVSREAQDRASVELSVEPGLSVLANDALLLRALSNVVRNAVRYAGASGPITIGAAREGRTVAITVADCGPGLPESELEQVFAPFYRPEQARTRESGGAGLGLAIVRTCVDACKGTVGCRNRQPNGLEVTIRLAAA